jgi:Tol biopolymer transport system component
VLFASDRDGDFELVIANEDGSDPQPVTSNDEFDGAPSFSPDGDQVVFVRGDPEGATDLFLLDIEDCDPANPDTCEVTQLTDTPEPETSPDWSPQSDSIVFARDVAFDPDNPESSTPNLELFTIDPGSRDEEQLTNRDGNDTAPQFSPDGERVVFEQFGSGGTHEIAVLDVENGGTGQVTRNSVPEGTPLWLDDDTIAFVRPEGEDFVVVSINLNEGVRSERELLTRGEVALEAVSDDGERLFFTADGDLFAADIDGENEQQLTEDGTNVQADVFEP